MVRLWPIPMYTVPIYYIAHVDIDTLHIGFRSASPMACLAHGCVGTHSDRLVESFPTVCGTDTCLHTYLHMSAHMSTHVKTHVYTCLHTCLHTSTCLLGLVTVHGTSPSTNGKPHACFDLCSVHVLQDRHCPSPCVWTRLQTHVPTCV